MTPNSRSDHADAPSPDGDGDDTHTRDSDDDIQRTPPPDERTHPAGRRTSRGLRVDPDAEAEASPRRAVIAALVDHEPGVLASVAGLFSARQFNIESLTVGPTTDSDLARMTVVVEEPDPGIAQVKKQLAKLRTTHAVSELEATATRRELAMVKVDATDPAAVNAVTEMYDGHTVDAGSETVTVEVTGSRQKIEAAIDAFGRFGVREVVRTGTAALDRGSDALPAQEARGDVTPPTVSQPASSTGTSDSAEEHSHTDTTTHTTR